MLVGADNGYRCLLVLNCTFLECYCCLNLRKRLRRSRSSDATFFCVSQSIFARRPTAGARPATPTSNTEQQGCFRFHREFRSRPGRIVRQSRTPARFALVAALLAACSVYPVAAQTTFATITGTVTDPGGAIVPNAKIEVVHVASNYRYETQSNSVGNYTLAQLRDGEYTLRATAPGFSSFEAKEIQIIGPRCSPPRHYVDSWGRSKRPSKSPPVQQSSKRKRRESATLEPTHEIEALPLARYLWGQMAATPGITTSTEGSWRRFAGSQLGQSSASIDGVTTDDLQMGNQISPLTGYVDSYQEVRIDSVNNNAEFGTVGNVSAISKSGTNDLHGTAFDYYSTPAFRARNPFASQRGTGVSHQPGASIGGPVIIPKLYNGKNRTFFFYSLRDITRQRRSTAAEPDGAVGGLA